MALVIATMLAFGAAFRASFQFDDIQSIDRNPTIERLWPPSVPLNPPRGIAVSGRPAVNYSLAVNHALNDLFGVDQNVGLAAPNKTVGYHIVNIVIHILNGLLLLGIIRRTIRSGRGLSSWSDCADTIAVVVAALWLLHPLQTEAVDYVVQRTELLVSACYLSTLYMSIRAWDAASARATRAWCVAAVVACLVGMWSKEVMVSAPFAVMLYDRTFRFSSWKQAWRFTGGRGLFYTALLLTLIPLAVSIFGGARTDTVGFNLGLRWYQYLYSQGWAVAHYLQLVFWPAGLSFDYGTNPVRDASAVPGLILLVALAVGTVVAWVRLPWLGFLGTLFFLILAPSSSVVPIRTEIAAERRVYLALASVLIALVVGADWLRRRFARNTDRIAPWLFGGIVAVLVLLSARRSALYENPERLWRDAVAKVPSNPRAYDNLAAAVLLADSSRTAEAEQLFRQAIAIDSTYGTGWTNLADIEMQRGNFPEARALLEHELSIHPDDVNATERLGGVLLKLGDAKGAIPRLERVTASFPNDEAWAMLAQAYLAGGRADDAAAALRRALALNPQRFDAAAFLGAMLAEQGRPDEAIGYLESATRGPATAPLYGVLSFTAAQLGRGDEAMSAAGRAATLANGDAKVFIQIGRAMMVLQNVGAADGYFGRAVQLEPSNLEAITRLGIIKAAAGREAEATQLFRRALSIDPTYGPAKQALEKVGRTNSP